PDPRPRSLRARTYPLSGQRVRHADPQSPPPARGSERSARHAAGDGGGAQAVAQPVGPGQLSRLNRRVVRAIRELLPAARATALSARASPAPAPPSPAALPPPRPPPSATGAA